MRVCLNLVDGRLIVSGVSDCILVTSAAVCNTFNTPLDPQAWLEGEEPVANSRLDAVLRKGEICLLAIPIIMDPRLLVPGIRWMISL